jgi:DNA-binding MarR family transcriptional regulator
MSEEISTLNKELAMQIGMSCVSFNLRKSTRHLTQLYDRSLKPAGIKSTQFALLMTVFFQEGTTMSRLAKILNMDRTTLSRNVKLLAQRKLINIEEGKDRREQLISINKSGRDILEKAIPLWKEAQQAVTNELGEQRLQSLMADLNILNHIDSSK